MNTNGPDRFDDAIRVRHAASLEQLSPRTRAQLQLRKRAALAGETPRVAGPAWRFAWPIAVACTLGAVVLGLQIRGLETPAPQEATRATVATPATTATAAMSTTTDEATTAYAGLEENPDLYVWLASDGAALAME